jgi:hypothetical protein
VSIAFSSIRRSPQELAEICISMNPVSLSRELTEVLLPLVPTSEEVVLVQPHDADKLDVTGGRKLCYESFYVHTYVARVMFR